MPKKSKKNYNKNKNVNKNNIKININTTSKRRTKSNTITPYKPSHQPIIINNPNTSNQHELMHVLNTFKNDLDEIRKVGINNFQSANLTSQPIINNTPQPSSIPTNNLITQRHSLNIQPEQPNLTTQRQSLNIQPVQPNLITQRQSFNIQPKQTYTQSSQTDNKSNNIKTRQTSIHMSSQTPPITNGINEMKNPEQQIMKQKTYLEESDSDDDFDLNEDKKSNAIYQLRLNAYNNKNEREQELIKIQKEGLAKAKAKKESQALKNKMREHYEKVNETYQKQSKELAKKENAISNYDPVIKELQSMNSNRLTKDQKKKINEMLKNIDKSTIGNTQYVEAAIKKLDKKFKDEVEQAKIKKLEQDRERNAPRYVTKNEPHTIKSSSNYNNSDKMGII